MKKLSPTQLAWLESLSRGDDPYAELEGRSAFGGAAGTRFALARRGLIDPMTGVITDAGRAAVGQTRCMLPGCKRWVVDGDYCPGCRQFLEACEED